MEKGRRRRGKRESRLHLVMIYPKITYIIPPQNIVVLVGVVNDGRAEEGPGGAVGVLKGIALELPGTVVYLRRRASD